MKNMSAHGGSASSRAYTKNKVQQQRQCTVKSLSRPPPIIDSFTDGRGTEMSLPNLIPSPCGTEQSVTTDDASSSSSSESSPIRLAQKKKHFSFQSISAVSTKKIKKVVDTIDAPPSPSYNPNGSASGSSKKSKNPIKQVRRKKKANNGVQMQSLDPNISVTIRITSSNSKRELDTNVIVSLGIIIQRENEMRHVALQQETNWNSSLIYQTCQDNFNSKGVANPNITIVIPSNDSSVPDFSKLIHVTLNRFFQDGVIYCGDEAQGPDILHLLEHFQILYFPNQMHFESIGAYLRVRMWAHYFLKRSELKEYVLNEILRGNKVRRGVGFIVLLEEDHLEYIFNGRKLTKFAGGMEMAIELFTPEEEQGQNHDCTSESIDEVLRQDFAFFLQASLPGTNVWFRVENVKRATDGGIDRRAVLYVDFHPKPTPKLQQHATNTVVKPKSSSTSTTTPLLHPSTLTQSFKEKKKQLKLQRAKLMNKILHQQSDSENEPLSDAAKNFMETFPTLRDDTETDLDPATTDYETDVNEVKIIPLDNIIDSECETVRIGKKKSSQEEDLSTSTEKDTKDEITDSNVLFVAEVDSTKHKTDLQQSQNDQGDIQPPIKNKKDIPEESLLAEEVWSQLETESQKKVQQTPILSNGIEQTNVVEYSSLKSMSNCEDDIPSDANYSDVENNVTQKNKTTQKELEEGGDDIILTNDNYTPLKTNRSSYKNNEERETTTYNDESGDELDKFATNHWVVDKDETVFDIAEWYKQIWTAKSFDNQSFIANIYSFRSDDDQSILSGLLSHQEHIEDSCLDSIQKLKNPIFCAAQDSDLTSSPNWLCQMLDAMDFMRFCNVENNVVDSKKDENKEEHTPHEEQPLMALK